MSRTLEQVEGGMRKLFAEQTTWLLLQFQILEKQLERMESKLFNTKTPD